MIYKTAKEAFFLYNEGRIQSMYKTSSPGTASKGYRKLLNIMLIIGFVCLSIIATLVSTTTTTYAAGRPGGNVTDPVVRAVDVAEPAVVRIFTTVGGHLTVHFSNTSSVTFPQSGSAYPLLLSGSGTFITAHGDILTADHVINPPHDQSLDQFLNHEAATDVATYINQNSKPGSSPVTSDQVEQALNNGQLASDHKYDPATSEVYLSTSYTGPLSASDFQSLPGNLHATVDRIEMESSINEKDVAIVHVSLNDMPIVQLGDSTNVQQQDELTIIGFPGNGDVSNKPTDLLTSSINKINVSSIKTTDSGAEVIQVGGNVEHGDSGGPALDNTGAVVGIVSFGLSSPDSPGGTSFLQASNSAQGLSNHFIWIPLLAHFKKRGTRLSQIMQPAPLVIGTRHNRNLRELPRTILSSRLSHLTSHMHRRRREMSRYQTLHGRPLHQLAIL